MIINKKLIDSIVAKTKKQLYENVLMTFDDLYLLVRDEEQAYIKELLKVKPKDYGILEPFSDIEDVPSDVVAIRDQKVFYDGKTLVIDTQYLPRTVFEAYDKLRQAYKEASGRNMLVGSGYRSAANQAANFFYWLQHYGYDLKKTLGFVSIPGYSEHSMATKTGVDFKTEGGVGVFDAAPFGRFDEEPEYPWLQEHAGEYGFVLSCPKGNKYNQEYEPWHWQFRGVNQINKLSHRILEP